MSVYDVSGVELSNAFTTLGISLNDVYDVAGNRIGLDSEPTFLDTAILTALSSVPTSGTKQGGCTDGEYIYQTAGDAANYTYMQVIKYKISDGTYTVQRFDGTPNFGHANDMCYNPNTGYLYVCTMLTDGSVIVLDSSDLSYIGTVYLKNAAENHYAVWQFCYDRDSDHFLSVNGNNILIYSQSWQYISSIPIPEHLSATGQGCETDGRFFYRVTYNPNYIDVLRLYDGTRAAIINNPMTGEPETLMYDWAGNFYINKNTTGTIFYKIQITA